MIRASESTREGLYSLFQLEQIQSAQPSSVGMQALWLSQLPRETVADSAVIPADALELFLEQLEWQSPLLQDFPHLRLHLNLEQSDQLQAIAQTLQTSLEDTPLPTVWSKDWVNRLQGWQNQDAPLSGADASGSQAQQRLTAGPRTLCLCLTPSLWLPAECDTDLVGLADLITPQYCSLTLEDLAHSVKQLWKQLFQAQILYLWEQSGLSFEQLRLAIVLQPVSTSTLSGWFHVAPDDLLIQAISGLPVGLLLGDVKSSWFQVKRGTEAAYSLLGPSSPAYGLVKQAGSSKIALETSATATSLSDRELEALKGLAHRLEPHMTTPTSSFRWSLGSESDPQIQVHEVMTVLPWPVFDLSIESMPGAGEVLVQGLSATPGVAISTTLVTQNLQSHAPETVANTILVIPSCQPSDLPWLQQAAGLICEQGGLTSHCAILAREVGLPAVLGFSDATTLIQAGQQLRLDGDRGMVSHAPSAQQASRSESKGLSEKNISLKTQVWVTLSQLQNADAASQLPVEGVGLLRSEWLFLDLLQRQHPQEWIQQGKHQLLAENLVNQLQPIFETFAPRPVFYRTLDGTTRELEGLKGGGVEPSEVNPALGLRGVARYQADPQLFDCELAALAELQQRGWENVRLLLPFVRSVEEFVWCCDRISTAGLFQSPSFEVWIMAEVPSVLFLLEDYVKAGVQGIAIGSNDLTQLILGVDREQPLLDPSLNLSHPAVMAAMSQLIKTANTLDIPCSLCGQLPTQHTDVLEKIVEWGITALSVDMQAVLQFRRILSEIEQR